MYEFFVMAMNKKIVSYGLISIIMIEYYMFLNVNNSMCCFFYDDDSALKFDFFIELVAISEAIHLHMMMII